MLMLVTLKHACSCPGGRTGGIQSRGMEQIGGAPGVYDTPPLAGQPPLLTGLLQLFQLA